LLCDSIRLWIVSCDPDKQYDQHHGRYSFHRIPQLLR
jgi:hypothetical protein